MSFLKCVFLSGVYPFVDRESLPRGILDSAPFIDAGAILQKVTT